MPFETVAIASDHAGFPLKSVLKDELAAIGFPVLDLGTDDTQSVDYPDFGFAAATAVGEGRARWGVLVCGTGIGMSIAANRDRRVRAALVHDAVGARMARQHNNANIVCFGGRTTTIDVARECLRIFLETDFEGGRHGLRVDKLSSPPGV